jgi:Flp pilus assembly pilin Flp
MLMEERELAYQFPAYREYAQRTPRLIPSLRTTEGVEPRAFRSRAARAAGTIRRPRPLRSLTSEDGQALVEYAAILVLVSIVAVVSLDTIGGFVSGAISSIAGGL